MRLRHWIAIPLALLLAGALASAAHASGADVIRDCTLDGQLNKTYTAKEIADALAHLPADVDEYSDCRDVLRRAQLRAASGGKDKNGGGGTTGTGGGGTTGGGTTGGTGGGGGGAGGTSGGGGTSSAAVDPLTSATPQERASFQKAVEAGSAPVPLDGRPVTPGSLGGAKSSGLSDLPTPLLVVLALLAAGAVGGLGAGTRRLVLSRRPT
jgi:hypothetical protein